MCGGGVGEGGNHEAENPKQEGGWACTEMSHPGDPNINYAWFSK